MDEMQTATSRRVFAVVNAHSGNAAPEQVRQALRSVLPADRECEFHESREGENLTEVVRAAVRRGFDTVVAAGGDGTVSFVANGVLESDAKLAIIPLGTTNVLARELGIPLDVQGACDLLAGASHSIYIDGMRVGDACYFTQIGVGVDALMIHDTTENHKRWLGASAYVWAMIKNLTAYKARRMMVTADERRVRTRSLQILLANCGSLGVSRLRWGSEVHVDDGAIDVCIFRPKSPLDYPRIAWNFFWRQHNREPRLIYLRASRTIVVEVDRALPVQGDGEIIGQTPLNVEVVPRAVRVIVPAAKARH